MIHCAIGARPTSTHGNTGIHMEYAQLPRAKLLRSLSTVKATARETIDMTIL